MDKVRSNLRALEQLPEALAAELNVDAKKQQLEARLLELTKQKAHTKPIHIQIRNLDTKIEKVRGQIQGYSNEIKEHEDEIKRLQECIGSTRKALQKATDSEKDLVRERDRLVVVQPSQAGTKEQA
eukprot:10710843-Alexandrium_andersonii.AAC.1